MVDIDYPNVQLFAMDLSNFENKWVVHDTNISNYKDSSSGNQIWKYSRELTFYLCYRPLVNL